MTFKFKREQQGLVETDPTTKLLQTLRDDLKFYKEEEKRLMVLAKKKENVGEQLKENLAKIKETSALIKELDEQ